MRNCVRLLQQPARVETHGIASPVIVATNGLTTLGPQYPLRRAEAILQTRVIVATDALGQSDKRVQPLGLARLECVGYRTVLGNPSTKEYREATIHWPLAELVRRLRYRK